MSGRGVNKAHQKSWGIEPLQIARHLVQLITLIVLNGKLFGIASTAVIVPYLWTSASPWSVAIGGYEALEYSIAKTVFPILVLGIIFLTAVTVGRLLCGWACPFGLVQDLLSYIPLKKEKLSSSTVSSLQDLRRVLVGFSVITSILVGFQRSGPNPLDHARNPIGVFSDSPFSVFSPSGTLFAYLPWMMLWNCNALASAGFQVGLFKFAFFVAILVPSVSYPRFFCRFLCPLSFLLEPLSAYKLLRLHKTVGNDEFNKTLSEVCPMGVQQDEGSFVDNPGCITCGKCLTEFPTSTSLQLHFG